MTVDDLQPEVQHRLALLQELLGVAQKTGRMDADELVQVLANGLDVTVQEAVELLRLLRELMGAGGGGEHGEATAGVATKSQRPRRDARGRRVDDPLGLGKGREDEPGGPRRDRNGKRLNKPFAPTRTRR